MTNQTAPAGRTVLLASPRSLCAGVERAIETVQRALRTAAGPVYVRKQIVHNSHVVAGLRARGAIFVDELEEIPDPPPKGAVVVFSAHGVSPAVRAEAARRGLDVIDATYPLATKVDAPGRCASCASAGGSALALGLAYLERSVDELGVPRARVSVDLGFRQSFGVADAGAWLDGILGEGLGFRLGEEGFSAMLTLALLPAAGVLSPRARRHVADTVNRCRQGWRFRFFLDGGGFPPDTDCTAMASAALYERGLLAPGELAGFARELLRAAAPDGHGGLCVGAPMVYWTDSGQHGPKQDAVACANALVTLRAAQPLGLEDPAGVVAAATRYVSDHLRSGRYLDGTRYYPSPEAFLFAASRLCQFPDLRATLAPWVREAVAALHEAGGPPANDPLSLALRICAADNAGLRDGQRQRRDALLAQQEPDGAWPARAYYKLGRHPVYFGSATLTTLFALRALADGNAGD